MDMLEVWEKIHGHEYRIGYTHERYVDVECWITGEIVTYCNRNVAVYNEDKGLYTIPWSAIKWMLPIL